MHRRGIRSRPRSAADEERRSMPESILDDNPQTVELLRSMTRLVTWMRSLPPPERHRSWLALANCSEEQQAILSRMLGIVESSHSGLAERREALTTISETLGLPADDHPDGSQQLTAGQQAAFALRLRELMDTKRISQQELANRLA